MRQCGLTIGMLFFITMANALYDQAGATPPSRMAKFLFTLNETCLSPGEVKYIVLENKSIILEKLGEKFKTVTVGFKSGNPANPFEGLVARKIAEFDNVDFIFKYMSVSEYLSSKVIFPLKNRFYLCSVPMVLKGHACLLTKEGNVLLNYYPQFEAVAKNETDDGTVIYSDFKIYLSGSPALYFWFWIDSQGNIYTLPM